MNRNITPINTENNNIIIRDDQGTIYGFKFLRRVSESGTSEKAYVLTGININLFVAYLTLHWPNHWAVKALAEATEEETVVTPEMLEDVSEEITLTMADVRELEFWAKNPPPNLKD